MWHIFLLPQKKGNIFHHSQPKHNSNSLSDVGSCFPQWQLDPGGGQGGQGGQESELSEWQGSIGLPAEQHHEQVLLHAWALSGGVVSSVVGPA